MIVRVRTRQGIKRVEIEEDSTLGFLRGLITSITDVFPESQVLSLDPSMSNPLSTDGSSLQSLGITNGTMIYLKTKDDKTFGKAVEQPHTQISTSSTSSTNQKKDGEEEEEESKCNHGPHAKCINCQDTTSTGKKLKWLCTHRPDQKCVNCIGNTKDVATGVCNHDDNMRCPNCPPLSKKKKKQKTKLQPLPCQHGPNAQCVRCLPPTTDAELDEIDVRCARHGPNASCIACLERLEARKLTIRRQARENTPARKAFLPTNGAQAHATAALKAYKSQTARGALLFGRYKKNGNVMVEAFYEPAQRGNSEGFVFDDSEKDGGETALARQLAALLGWECVGWSVTVSQTQQQKRSPSGLSAAELVRATHLHALFHPEQQTDASQPAVGDSRRAFITLVVKEVDGAASFEAYQVSKQAATLQRRGAMAEIQDDQANVLLTQDALVEGSETRVVPLEFFLIPTAIKAHDSSFLAHFPATRAGEEPPSISDLKSQLMGLADLPFVKRIKDFNLLLYLAKHLDVNSDLPALCNAVKQEDTQAVEGFSFIINALAGIDHH